MAVLLVRPPLRECSPSRSPLPRWRTHWATSPATPPSSSPSAPGTLPSPTCSIWPRCRRIRSAAPWTPAATGPCPAPRLGVGQVALRCCGPADPRHHGGRPVVWTVGASSVTFPQGQGGLPTTRLECSFGADVAGVTTLDASVGIEAGPGRLARGDGCRRGGCPGCRRPGGLGEPGADGLPHRRRAPGRHRRPPHLDRRRGAAQVYPRRSHETSRCNGDRHRTARSGLGDHGLHRPGRTAGRHPGLRVLALVDRPGSGRPACPRPRSRKDPHGRLAHRHRWPAAGRARARRLGDDGPHSRRRDPCRRAVAVDRRSPRRPPTRGWGWPARLSRSASG